MDLASLIAPCSIAELREKYWNRASAFLPGPPERFADLAFDLDTFCRQLHFERVPGVKAQFLDALGRHQEMPIAATQIEKCFAAGMTICFSELDTALPALSVQAQEIRRSLGMPGPMNFSCYWSPNSKGFGVHYDDHAVFIFQIRGRKRWRYGRSPIVLEPRENFVYSPDEADRLRSHGLDVVEPRDEDLESVILTPGDILFLPAGTWHETLAVEGESLSLTFRGFDGAPAHVVHHCLRTWMDRVGGWRLSMPPVEGHETIGGRLPPVIESVLATRLELLKRFAAELTVRDLARAWAELQSFTLPREDPPAPLTPDSKIGLRRNVRALRLDGAGGDTFYVYDGESETELPVGDNGWFADLLRVDEQAAIDATRWGGVTSTWEETRGLLQDLLDKGIIEVRTPSGQPR